MPVRLDLNAVTSAQPVTTPAAPSLSGKFSAAMGNASARPAVGAGTSSGIARGLTLAQQKALATPTPAASPTPSTPPLTNAAGFAGLSAADKQKVQDSVIEVFASVDNGIAMGGNFQGVGLDKE